MTIGEKLSPILVEIEEGLWHVPEGVIPHFTDEGFRAATKIFMEVFMDKMFALQQREGIALDDAAKMAHQAGEDLKQMIKTYTGIDTAKMYEKV